MYRDFTYIDDIVEGIVKILNKTPESKPPYKVYNTGNSTPVKLLDFIQTIENALGQEAKEEYCDMQPGDVHKRFTDAGNLEKDFGYAPDTPLKKGIDEFVKWYNAFYK